MQTPIDPEDIEKNKDMAAIGYVWILSLAVWVAKRQSPFVRFHVRQGLALFLLSILFSMIPLIGRPLVFLTVVGMIIGFIHAGRGEAKSVPIIGELVDGKLTWSIVKGYGMSTVRAVKKFFGR